MRRNKKRGELYATKRRGVAKGNAGKTARRGQEKNTDGVGALGERVRKNEAGAMPCRFFEGFEFPFLAPFFLS
jgi:hypothetical protein